MVGLGPTIPALPSGDRLLPEAKLLCESGLGDILEVGLEQLPALGISVGFASGFCHVPDYVYVRTDSEASGMRPAFTHTHVTKGSHNGSVAGRKPETFTPAENDALRKVLRETREKNGWSQLKVGELLNISQQTAGTILNRGGGFGRPTALKLAELLGFGGPEELLESLGALASAKAAAPGTWRWRELAAGLARRSGVRERAIERVNARYTESEYLSRDTVWWMNKYTAEELEMAVTPPPQPPAPKTRRSREDAPVPMTSKRMRKTA